MSWVNRAQRPAHWELVTMGDIATVVGGSTPKSKQPKYWGGDVPWLGVSDLTGYTGKYIAKGARSITQAGYDSCSTQMVPAGTVLYSSRAPIGYVAIAAHPVCTSQGFKSFVVVPSVNNEYVYWYLRFAKPLAEAMASGTTFKELSGRGAAALPIPLPPRREQDLIVARIEQLRAKLDSGNLALNAGLDGVGALKASLLQHLVWKGPAAGGDPTDTAARLRSERTVAWERRRKSRATRGRYKPPLRVVADLQVPDGWTLASLDEVCEFVTDGDHNPPKRQSDGIPHLTAKNVDNGGLDFTNVTFISPSDFELVRQRYEPRAKDVIVTCVGTIGRVGVVPDGCVFSPDRNLAGLRPLPSVLPRFLAAVLNTPQLQMLMRDASGSTAQPHLYLGDLRALPIPVPPVEIQKRVVAQVDSAMQRVASGEARLTQARAASVQLDTALLRDAFSGALVRAVAQGESASTLVARATAELAAMRKEKRANRKNRRAVLVAE